MGLWCHDGGVCHRCHNRCIRGVRPVVGPPQRRCALHEGRCRAGEILLQSQTRTSRRVEQLPLNGAVQTAVRHARKVGRVLIIAIARPSLRKQRVQIALDAQAIFFRRRHQPRRPPAAKIRPGRPPQSRRYAAPLWMWCDSSECDFLDNRKQKYIRSWQRPLHR
jgi:hypothetical protein